MTMQFRDLAEQVAADGAIAPDEILSLRRLCWENGYITPDEAEAIFVANDRISQPDAAWIDFFVEALGEFIVDGSEPRGYVGAEQADWLIARIEHDGKLDSLAELELIARICERAKSIPERLQHFALYQIEQAVLTGQGPTRDGGALEPGCVSAAECRLLRRFIFAPAGDRPAAVGRSEAEMLFRLKDASLGKANAPEWKQLFVQGVGNYLTGYVLAEHATISAERAATLEEFMRDGDPHFGRFFGRLVTSETNRSIGRLMLDAAGYFFAPASALSLLLDVIDRLPTGQSAPEAERIRQHDARVAAAGKVDVPKDTWLLNEIDADDQIDEFDHALLAFLAEETPRG